jgi:hypothetical protein
MRVRVVQLGIVRVRLLAEAIYMTSISTVCWFVRALAVDAARTDLSANFQHKSKWSDVREWDGPAVLLP